MTSNLACNEETAVMQREGDSEKHKAYSGSQDISQISGPDGKSKSTPLSQIGFQDPASVGGGQQLTLLSIEVCLSLLTMFCRIEIFCKLN